MIPIIICITVIICVGFVCGTYIHAHDKVLKHQGLIELEHKINQLDSAMSKFNEKLKEIELLAEDAKKQLTAHNVAQGFKIGK